MTHLLFPGRHHLLTGFQLDYLTWTTSGDPAELRDVDGKPLDLATPIDAVIWAISSANHANTRRNPLPAHRREAAIEEFARDLDVPSFVYLIDDLGHTPRYAEYVLKKIEVDSQGRFRLTPENAVVGCSTPQVIAMFERLGFRILPFELTDREQETYADLRPWDLIESLVETGLAGREWRTDRTFVTKTARATRRMFDKYGYGDLIVDLHRRPILTDDGDLTATRNYNTYVRSFDEGAPRKYAQIGHLILPGRIVDIGCCTGSLIREMTRDDRLRESDFYGIEVARPLYAECLHRKEQGAFQNENVFFYQRDFAAGPIFPEGSVNTFTTVALTHEIESYGGRDSLLHFLDLLYRQTAMGGRWVNLDVLGPEDRDETVYLRLRRDDGVEENAAGREFDADDREALRAYLAKLSTYGRFQRFARDFRREEGYEMHYREAALAGEPLIELRLEDACEFLSKKDYLDNWQSELHERFCFWSFADWRAAVEQAGFRINPTSHAFVNDWLVENRYRGQADLLAKVNGEPAPLPYPPTHFVLAADKAS
ncbi:MAG: class I SAM-dependent methyltransferase [Planctomycetes bacterium]|nr:class I SAM-dependent methyltransferase [Planctomycetota bacterium]